MTEDIIQHASPREMVCPTCSARQTRSNECRRCKTDLSLLQQIWQMAEMEHLRCLRELSAGHPREALRHARRYADYVGQTEASRLLGVCSLLCEDWPNAIRS